MKLSRLATIAILASALMVSACANTIRASARTPPTPSTPTEAAGNKRRQGCELAAIARISATSASQAEARTLCLRFMYSLAVSTATAASRQ